MKKILFLSIALLFMVSACKPRHASSDLSNPANSEEAAVIEIPSAKSDSSVSHLEAMPRKR